ncbi:vacuolar protein sorting-associated protein 37A [Toxorhynchites rutilus septentrionalis]|uniref:vacuolar protein sorting-associated protein 37A n=1 Tax=Toxorhynchites rutilus septentrionalis TaxID=329112 RepID=UPI00247AFBFB|nr:vacuolar protein sorting-associated protein 37A [Toxorhynchites rutilus septentrionalis]
MRKRQIDTLKIFNLNVQEVKDNEEYLVNFDSGGREIAINIILGAGFPNEKPKLIVSPILSHPWVNSSTGEIEGAPGILNYTIHSDLGRVVQAISREFEKHPPGVLNDRTSTPQHVRNGNIHELARTNTASPVGEQDVFNLRTLAVEELARLNGDEDYLEDFIDKLGFIQNQNKEMNQLMDQIEALAVDNLTKKKFIDERREKLQELFLSFKELGEKYELSNQKYQRKSEDFSPQHIKELLQIAVSTADASSDEEAHKFLAGDTDVNTFLSNFIETRKSYTMRKAKEERLTQQLDALERAAF